MPKNRYNDKGKSKDEVMKREVGKAKNNNRIKDEYDIKWEKLNSMRFETIEATQRVLKEIRTLIDTTQNSKDPLPMEDYAKMLTVFKWAAIHHGSNIDAAVNVGFYDPKSSDLNILEQRDEMIKQLARLDNSIDEAEVEVILLEGKEQDNDQKTDN
jgi:hypothetical protein